MPGGLRLKPQTPSRSADLTGRQKLCKFWQLIWLPANHSVPRGLHSTVTIVGEALRLLDLPVEDHGWIQITVLPDGDHVIFAECKSHCKAGPLDDD